jgi:hypothetical protein
MLGHGVGIVETMAGLDRFLTSVEELLTVDGQILLDSVDVRATDDPVHLAYHEANRSAGRYIGEIRVRFEFKGKKGPTFGWLHIDPGTLKVRAKAMGWSFENLQQEQSGEYLARLARMPA